MAWNRPPLPGAVEWLLCYFDEGRHTRSQLYIVFTLRDLILV